jgi:hypothetical protein
MQMTEEDECADWGIGWYSDISLHQHSTSDQSTMGLEQLGSSEYSDFQQQKSGNCLGIESLDAAV